MARARSARRDGRRERPRPHALEPARRDPQGDRSRALPADLDRAVGGERDRDAAPGPDARSDRSPTTCSRPRSRSSASVDRVVISDLADETFHARLFLERDGRRVEIDSRPSDALALAVRAGVRIFAAEAVLDQAGARSRRRPSASDEASSRRRAARDDRRADRRSAPRRVPRLRELARRRPGGEPRGPPSAELGRRVGPGLSRRAIGSPRGGARARRFDHSRSRSHQKSLTARKMTLRLRAGRRAGRPRVVRARRPRRSSGPAARSLMSSSAEKNAPPDSTRMPSSASRRNSLQAQSTSRTGSPKKIRLASR